jgi:hypothetical protein
MKRVAAKVAQEILVLFQDDDIDAITGEKKAGHHACRSAAHDAAARFYRFHHQSGLLKR